MLHSLCYIDWDVDPVLFSIGGFHLRYYSLFFAIAFLLGYLIFARLMRDQRLPEEWTDKVFIYTIVATIIGSRLGHVLFYAWDYYSQHPLEILMVWKGGLASHGGTIGIIVALYLFDRRVSHKGILWILDCIVIPIALAAFFIRMGNLMNSEIVGRPTDVPWAFRFLRLHPDDALAPRHPTQIYEALWYLATFGLIWWLYWKKHFIARHGAILGVFFICVFGFRFLIEHFKENQEAFEEGMALNMGQLLSLPFIVLGVASLWYALSRPADPGVHTGGN